jgi:hypothetical protein
MIIRVAPKATEDQACKLAIEWAHSSGLYVTVLQHAFTHRFILTDGDDWTWPLETVAGFPGRIPQ